MVGDNKILTVSYGTFSCTLEGFDDPFSAMRQIAEYFRDLAADDRYFGAEPLTPDPDRLHMIAQSNTKAAVEAQISTDGSIALRQADDLVEFPEIEPEITENHLAEETRSQATPEAQVPASDEQNEDWKLSDPETPSSEDVNGFDPIPEDNFQEPKSASVVEPLTEAGPDASVIEKLARIRAAVSGDRSVPDTELEDDLASSPRVDPVVASLRDAFRDDPVGPVEEEFEPEDDAPSKGAANDVSDRDIKHEPVMVLEMQIPPKPRPAPEGKITDSKTVTAGADKDEMAHSTPPQQPGKQADEGARILKKAALDTDAENGTADRIFQQADNHLEDTEARRRHSAIAHLKAAVSATVADRDILGWRTRKNAEEEVAYREDLAKAVRPVSTGSRATGNEASVEADEPEEPSKTPVASEWDEELLDAFEDDLETDMEPLVLDADDRIKAMEQRAKDAPPQAGENFSQFAERVGAQGLGELLEAAAAYSGQIQGIPQFSRPHIMKQVAEATNDSFSREDGLRSFGILLRQGKIEKLKRGVFVLSDNSRFVERDRLAGE